jgi:hypothetical protein
MLLISLSVLMLSSFSPFSTKTSILVKNQKCSMKALTNLMMLSNVQTKWFDYLLSKHIFYLILSEEKKMVKNEFLSNLIYFLHFVLFEYGYLKF